MISAGQKMVIVVAYFIAQNLSTFSKQFWVLDLPNKPGLFQLVWLMANWFGSKLIYLL